MAEINILPDLLVNKIAAGEVIERPASVVKELVENSLDAGASRVEVTVEQGGRKLIQVVDNGMGMDAANLARAVLPHATSKIRREEDLFAIHTMGFRGEALPSIGAVSQMRIVSRPQDSDEAHAICVAGDKIESMTAAGSPPGTRIEVRELFFNVPARQKFMRTAQTEMGHITEQIARIALAHTGVEFRLTHNGRLVHHLRPGDSMRERISDLYGPELAENLLSFSREEKGLRLLGYAGRPADSRSSGKWQYIFLNGRYIRDRFIAHATREAYRGLMESNRHPVFFISLDVDPQTVDVNVHPTKSEVRWQDSNLIYSQVLTALRDRFLSANLTPDFNGQRAGGRHGSAGMDGSAGPGASGPRAGGAGALAGYFGPTSADPADDLAAERQEQVRRSIADYFKSHGPGDAPRSFAPAGGGRQVGGGGVMPWPTTLSSASGAEGPSGDSPAEPVRSGETAWGPAEHWQVGRDVIQIHNSYLVAESADGLTIIDQHALHERVLFEQLSRDILQGPLESQRLLIPETVDVSGAHLALIEDHAEVFAKLGFDLSAEGAQRVAVHAVPSLMKPERVAAFLRDALDDLAEREAPASGEMLMNDLIATMACKAAVKAGDPLTDEEIRTLMARRHQVERSTNCPHGRPTALHFTIAELEKQFKRT